MCPGPGTGCTTTNRSCSSRKPGSSLPATKGPSQNNICTLLPAPRPAGKARATSNTQAVCEERTTQPAGTCAPQPCGPQPEGAWRRGAVCVVGAPRRCTAASPVSHRLASGPPALTPKCKCYSVTGPRPEFTAKTRSPRREPKEWPEGATSLLAKLARVAKG